MELSSELLSLCSKKIKKKISPNVSYFRKWNFLPPRLKKILCFRKWNFLVPRLKSFLYFQKWYFLASHFFIFWEENFHAQKIKKMHLDFFFIFLQKKNSYILGNETFLYFLIFLILQFWK